MKNLLNAKFGSSDASLQNSDDGLVWFNSLSLEDQINYLLTDEVSSEILFALVKPANYLARSGSRTDFYQQTIASRRDNPLRVWFVLATQSTKKTLHIISQNENTPPHILDRLKYRKDEEIVLGLSKNKSTSWTTIEDMISGLRSSQHKKIYVMAFESILRRDNLSSHQLSDLIELMFREKKIVPTFSNGWRFNEPLTTLSLVVASSPELPSSVVDTLYGLVAPKLSDITDNTDLWYMTLVEKILLHPKLGKESFASTFSFVETLNPVLNDYTWILSSLLMNPSCPPYFLEKYCSSESMYVRSIAARHENCPEHAKVIAALS